MTIIDQTTLSGTVRTPQGYASLLDQNVVEMLSADYRPSTANSGNSFVPTGTSATAHPLKVKVPSVLVSWWYYCVVPPAAGESITLRLYRYTPTFYQLTGSPFVINAASVVTDQIVDISANLRPNVIYNPLEIVAASYVHAGAQQLQPLIMGWVFAPANTLPGLGPNLEAEITPNVWPPV